MSLNKSLCSECFKDQGLKLLAEKIGIKNSDYCFNCSTCNGFKLYADNIENLAYRFFVIGSIFKPDYGAAPLIQFNEYKKTNIKLSDSLNDDIKLFKKTIGIGFFNYGPRLWMVGEIEPLKDLQDEEKRILIFERIVNEFPTVVLQEDELFYRIRTNPKYPTNENEYDSSPFPGNGRLDTENHPVLYCSQDLEVCIHECRVTVEDEIYVATLKGMSSLKLLDLTKLLEESCTEFESLDLSVQMLFMASKHSYEISKKLSVFVNDKGFDGIIYPSYFSSVRKGNAPFQTVYGISTRRFSQYREIEKSNTIQNLAFFGNPIKEKKIKVKNINRLGLNRIIYDYQFGPAGIN